MSTISLSPVEQKLAEVSAYIKARHAEIDAMRHEAWKKSAETGISTTAIDAHFDRMKTDVVNDLFRKAEPELQKQRVPLPPTSAGPFMLSVSMPGELRGVVSGLVFHMMPPALAGGPAFQITLLMHLDADAIVNRSSLNVLLGHYNDPLHRGHSNTPLAPNEKLMELEAELASVESVMRNAVSRYEGDTALRAVETAHSLMGPLIAVAREIINSVAGVQDPARINPHAMYPVPMSLDREKVPGTKLQELLVRLDKLKAWLDPINVQSRQQKKD